MTEYGESTNQPEFEIVARLTKRLELSEEQRRELEIRVQLDEQTGLLKHGTWHEMVGHYLESDVPAIGIIFIDMNNLKRVNDTVSHEVADDLIMTTGRILRRRLRRGTNEEDSDRVDLVSVTHQRDGHTSGRLGGDEFGIMCDLGPTDEEKDATLDVPLRLRVIVHRLRNALEDMLEHHELAATLRSAGFGFAIGAASWEHDKDFSSLLREAEHNMHQDKYVQKGKLLTPEEKELLRPYRGILDRVVRTDFLD